MTALARVWLKAWHGLRSVIGDDAHDRYLDHLQRKHPGAQPLDRAAFYRGELERRWSKVSRCC